MNEDESIEYLAQRFPKLKAIKSAPTLFRVNGFGMGMAGRRDFDAETGTYLKTHCLTALFIPVFALGAYRVADSADGGWQFLGRENTSTVAKAWNSLFALAVVVLIGLGFWSAHTSSDSYKAKKSLAEAQAFEAEGKRVEAAAVYRDMVMKDLPEEVIAKVGISNNIKGALEEGSVAEVVAMIAFVENLPNLLTSGGMFIDDLGVQALSAAKRFTESNPEGAFEILNAGNLAGDQQDEVNRTKLEILERLAKQNPANPKFAVALAEVYYNELKTEEALGLLEPLKDSLGSGEGARIFGQLLLRSDRAQEATTHLQRYIEPRLESWRSAAKKFDTAYEEGSARVIKTLNKGDGPPSFYKRYDAAANEEEEDQIVQEYIYERMQRDGIYQRARKAYEKAATVAPVIMSLGVAQLQTAQGAANPAERKAKLEEAEKTFLTLQEAEGGSNDLNFFLGQVYYWSGKQEEGRKLFDELLASSGRDFSTLLSLSRTLREIGNTTEARELAEEAFNKGASPEEKGEAATQRALLYTDNEDEILWLERVPPGSGTTEIRLASARATKAVIDGNRTEALKFLKIAATGWARLPENATTLNNGSLVQQSLFSLTGDISHFEKGSKMMERAVALQPEDSILVGNAANSLLTSALMKTTEGSFHPRLVQAGLGLNSLRFLYDNAEEREVLLKKLGSTPAFRRGMDLLEKGMVLAPNSPYMHSTAATYYARIRNAEKLEQVVARVKEGNLDYSESRKAYQTESGPEVDDDMRRSQELYEKDLEKILAEVSEAAQKNIAKLNLTDVRLTRYSLGMPLNLDAEIAALRAIQTTGYSARLRGVLREALSQKALNSLSAGNDDFAKYVESGRREFPASDLLYFALTSDRLRPAALASDDAKTALQESYDYGRRFPASFSPSDWLIAKHLDPSNAEAVRTATLNNRIEIATAQFSAATTPWAASSVLTSYKWLLVEGKEAEARALLERARADKIPVPLL